ncbi:formylglycine-generating enzyme family protein [Pyxidicoccus caerfyrddinensis]|uniref:formylglycine-generating enzyme family protein n=1 Tax=Pyxidicoccus caerfyrddinensis TaxID=2709663 RepID=UPI0013DCB899|nr:SUMF1/EgtB/PvdO family nonheme iron enzyme [Pyxidicoccus caerfyrddinensis]
MGSTPEELEAWCASAPGGCTPDDRKRLERELPAHDVTLSPFQLDRREVTQGQFTAFLKGMVASVEVREDRDDHSPRFVYERSSGLLLADLHPGASGIAPAAQGHFAVRPSMEDKPVVQVTWDGASRYCRFLGKRLPTEAEWELAASGVARRVYPWGDAPPRCEGIVFGRQPGAGCEYLPSTLVDVGSAPDDVTPEGIHDLAGSVAEWVGDAFTRPYYEDCGECLNPRAPEPDVPIHEDLRLFRGGSYQSDALLSRSATRSRWKRGGVMAGLGLRCASD